ncbi:sigma-E factor negative regulatory protein [Duganella sp. Leaf126]|uniref:sigma-E factor negative regulatory protein n=1 Tax=Duganella sp. Leaf126 TaxID=1736266 RepID=UPI0009EAF7BF|nr:sigma-E factor negative regulatory protein [Duganella sp. Leaf126]
MDTHKRLHENISALADGELAQSEQELAFATLQTEEGRAAWQVYHLTGDVLRDSACGALSSGFDAALAARLAQEPAYRSDARPADLSATSCASEPVSQSAYSSARTASQSTGDAPAAGADPAPHHHRALTTGASAAAAPASPPARPADAGNGAAGTPATGDAAGAGVPGAGSATEAPSVGKGQARSGADVIFP